MQITTKTGNKFTILSDSLNEYIIDLDYPISCTCRDFTHRKAPIGAFCKHIKFILEELLRGKNNENIKTL